MVGTAFLIIHYLLFYNNYNMHIKFAIECVLEQYKGNGE